MMIADKLWSPPIFLLFSQFLNDSFSQGSTESDFSNGYHAVCSPGNWKLVLYPVIHQLMDRPTSYILRTNKNCLLNYNKHTGYFATDSLFSISTISLGSRSSVLRVIALRPSEEWEVIDKVSEWEARGGDSNIRGLQRLLTRANKKEVIIACMELTFFRVDRASGDTRVAHLRL